MKTESPAWERDDVPRRRRWVAEVPLGHLEVLDEGLTVHDASGVHCEVAWQVYLHSAGAHGRARGETRQQAVAAAQRRAAAIAEQLSRLVLEDEG